MMEKLREESARKKSTTPFVCPLVYTNELPDAPSVPKFQEYPFDADLLFKYNASGSTLERTFKFGINAQADAGVPINTIDQLEYRPPKQAPRLDPKDEALMSEEYAQPAGLKRVLQPHEVSIEHSWTFSSEYMDNDLSRNFYSHKNQHESVRQLVDKRHTDAQEAGQGKPKRQRILDGFDAINDESRLLAHPDPKKSHLTLKGVWNVLPDPQRYANQFVEVAFDVNPDDSAERKLDGRDMLDAEVQRQRVERALVRCPPATEGQDGQLGVLLLPDSEQEKDDDGAARLRQVRDYKLVAKPAKADEPTFVFMWDESGDVAQVFYSPVIARVELKKQHMQAARRDVRLQYRESTKAEDIQRQLKRVDIDHEEPALAEADLKAQLQVLEAEEEESSGLEED